MNFKGLDYRELLLKFKGGFRFFPAITQDNDHTGKQIYLRHDIDMRPDRAVQMAQIERDMGIRSTFFILDTATYFEQNLQKEIDVILSCGHEIGWHNDALQAWVLSGRKQPLIKHIETPLRKLRDYGVYVRGTAAHGVLPPWDQTFRNFNIFALPWNKQSLIVNEYFNLSWFGLEYETYFLWKNDYLCDSGNAWNHPPDEIARVFDESVDRVLHLLIHPQWWS